MVLFKIKEFFFDLDNNIYSNITFVIQKATKLDMSQKKLKAFRLKEKELQKIKDFCKEKDMTFSEFVREAIMNRLKRHSRN